MELIVFDREGLGLLRGLIEFVGQVGVVGVSGVHRVAWRLEGH